jgi:geranylgeranyl reductase family protein
MIYDVAIVGAGPAGASAAFTLEKSGYNIVLIDKEEFPRPKPCAGVLPPRIFSEIEVPKEVVERPLYGYRIFSPSGRRVESKFPKPGIIVRRENFDSYLLSRLKCEPEQIRIVSCEIEKDFVRLSGEKGTFCAKAVLGCDGVNSLFRKVVQKDETPRKRVNDMALAMQYEISLSDGVIDERIGNWFEVYYTLSYGYGWISPIKGAVKVGVGGVSEGFKKNIKKILDEFIEKEDVARKLKDGQVVKTEAHFIPIIGPLSTLSADRLLLCGDAGGFVFPGTGEGIYYAIKSGRIAGGVLGQALKDDDLNVESLTKAYNEQLEKNGLLSLRQVDFVEKVLSDANKAEKYVRKLGKLGEGNIS